MCSISIVILIVYEIIMYMQLFRMKFLLFIYFGEETKIIPNSTVF